LKTTILENTQKACWWCYSFKNR